jgi:hypothetical protein
LLNTINTDFRISNWEEKRNIGKYNHAAFKLNIGSEDALDRKFMYKIIKKRNFLKIKQAVSYFINSKI